MSITERRVGKPIAVGSEELVVVPEIALDSLQPLSDRRVRTRVGERDSPLAEILLE